MERSRNKAAKNSPANRLLVAWIKSPPAGIRHTFSGCLRFKPKAFGNSYLLYFLLYIHFSASTNFLQTEVGKTVSNKTAPENKN